jgi:hypothetical protein
MKITEPWQNYLQAYAAMIASRMTLHAHIKHLVPSVRESILRGGIECSAALAAIPCLPPDSQTELLPALTDVALVVSGDTSEARRVIATLPRALVVTYLSGRETEVLARNDYEEHACLLELWMELDCTSRAEVLAVRAAENPNEDVSDIGKQYLEKIRRTPPTILPHRP